MIPLSQTQKCQSNGYTCTLDDGPKCCEKRKPETRVCVPCDETRYKKPIGAYYIKAGTCQYISGGILMKLPMGTPKSSKNMPRHKIYIIPLICPICRMLHLE